MKGIRGRPGLSIGLASPSGPAGWVGQQIVWKALEGVFVTVGGDASMAELLTVAVNVHLVDQQTWLAHYQLAAPSTTGPTAAITATSTDETAIAQAVTSTASPAADSASDPAIPANP